MKLFRTILINAIFCFNILLLFLVSFRQSLDVPPLIQSIGRTHPLFLHIPIGLMVLVVLLIIFRKGFKKKSFHNFLNFVLYFLALTASFSAILGVLLSAEPGYDSQTLYRHLVSGVVVSIFSALLLGISLFLPDNKRVFNFTLFFSTLMLILAGHFGSVLTHGDKFILDPLSTPVEESIVNDSTPLYSAAVLPILQQKCTSCHNERKAKGKLIIHQNGQVTSGGKNGPLWIAGDAPNSNLVKRIRLPEDHEDHMPPSGKGQLSDREKDLLTLWIASGADMTTAWTRYRSSDTLLKVALPFINTTKTLAVEHHMFAHASDELIASLNTPFCTVGPLSADDPALFADFFLREAYQPAQLEALAKVKEQLIHLNLSKMPVTDQEVASLAKFTSLEKLALNSTAISGKALASLKGLIHLQTLSLAGTAVDKAALQVLGSIASLRTVYIWNTKTTDADAKELRKQFPTIDWQTGPPVKDVLKLTPPMLVNDDVFLDKGEEVRLKNNLPGTEIHYTLDGSQPDSVHGLTYARPIALAGYTLLRAKSYKPGWYSSEVSSFYFFRAGIAPVASALLSQPDKDYRGEGIKTLIDNKKGAADGFKDLAWLGFRSNPLKASFTFNNSSIVSRITLSYAENAGAYIFPPAYIEVWHGVDKDHLTLVKKEVPVQPTSKGSTEVKGIIISIPPQHGGYFEIVASPVSRVPAWVSVKPEKGWLFVDEVVAE